MAEETTFEVIFRGDIVAGQQLMAVKERLKALFKVDDARIEQLFSGRPEVIKKGLDQVTASRYRDTLFKAGALVQIRQQAAGTSASEAVRAPSSAPAAPVTQPAVATAVETAVETDVEMVTGDRASAQNPAVTPDLNSEPSPDAMLDAMPDAMTSSAPQVAPEASEPGAGWTLAPVGADVLRPEERCQVQPVVVDDVDFELAPAGVDLLKPEERTRVEAPDIDVSHLTVAALEEDKTS